MPNITPTTPGSWVGGQVSGFWKQWIGEALWFHAERMCITPEARRLHLICQTSPGQLGIVMNFKEFPYGLPYSLVVPKPVSDLDQWSQERQAYPVRMDSWLPDKSKRGKKTKMALRERWFQRWLPCQSKFPMVCSDFPIPSGQDSLCNPTHWLFPGLLPIIHHPKIHFSHTDLLISLTCTGSFTTTVNLLMPPPAWNSPFLILNSNVLLP